MKREFIILLASLMLIGLLGTASMGQEAGTWTQKADMPTARYIPGSAVVDGKIYVIGGAPVRLGFTAVVEEYDPATDIWTRRADMPTARQGVVAATVDGIIYAIGGKSAERGDLSTVEVYDPVADTWTTKTDMPTRRNNPAIAVVDGIIYVIGGNPGLEIVSAVEAYEPTTDTWTRKADMPTARYLLAACVVDGRIYVFGGATKYGRFSGVYSCVPTVEVYNPATDTWTQASDMPSVRMTHSASAVDGKIYIIGGGNPAVHQIGDDLPPTVDVYDPATDTWTTAADIPVPIGEHTASVVDGKIYAIGGDTGPGTAILSIVEEYDPGLPGVIPSVSSGEKLLETWGQMKKVQ
jgi:N-acetylneuraminic acid mutarotase